jgi:peptidoglycan/xylan/chitin deacetylase (PgdA/CDA1 family)
MSIDVDPSLYSVPPFVTTKGVKSLLGLLDKHTIKATFFVPSSVAEKFPDTLLEIAKRGHEVGCHGMNHDPWEITLDLNKQVQIIRTATETIQSVVGSRPVGFRAPLFKINTNCLLALEKNEYVYDSSIVCSPLYNNHRKFFPKKPFHVVVHKTDQKRRLLEIPVSSNPFLPFPLGGVPFRIFGLRWCTIAMKLNLIYQIPIVLYTHPKDVVPREYGKSWHSYRNTPTCLKMIDGAIDYAKRSGARFMKAIELAKLYESEFLQTN